MFGGESEVFKVGFSKLTRGQLYPIVKVVVKEEMFNGKTTKLLETTVLDEDVDIVTYLPKKVIESVTDEDIKKINDAGATSAKYSVCSYGEIKNSVVTSFVGRIHHPGQGMEDLWFCLLCMGTWQKVVMFLCIFVHLQGEMRMFLERQVSSWRSMGERRRRRMMQLKVLQNGKKVMLEL